MKRGNCYVTCEALYHLLGGKAAGYTPHTVRHEGAVHWYLVCDLHAPADRRAKRETFILDPTASQFKRPPPYSKGRGRGFLTREPSRRARSLMQTLVWQL